MTALKGSFWSPRLAYYSSTNPDPPIAPSEYAVVVEWLNDPRVVRYSEQRHRHHTETTQWCYLEKVRCNNNLAYWYIRKNQHDRPSLIIGTMTASLDPENSVANLGIMIGPEHQGQGYGVEAFKHGIIHLETCGIRRVEAGMMIHNAAMIRTCLSAGMEREAIVRGHFLLNGEPTDLIIMATQ